MELIDNYLSKPLFDELKLAFTSSQCQWYWDEESGTYSHKIYADDVPVSDMFQTLDGIFRRRLNATSWVDIKVQAYNAGQVPPNPELKGKYTCFFYLDTNEGITSLTTEDGHKTIDMVENRVVEVETDEYTHTTYDSSSDRTLILTMSYF